MKSILHVGCGGDPLPDWLKDFSETRLDISPINNPDIVANMTNMGDIGRFDVVFCQHALEHLACFDVSNALKEFQRVLKDGGHAIVFVPDLEDVKATEDILFISPAGPIAGLDLIYGYRKVLEEMPYMAHKTGFIKSTIETSFTDSGFSKVEAKRLENYNLMCVGIK